MRYIALVTDDLHLGAFRAKMREQGAEVEQVAMTIAEQMRREGREEGRLQERAAMLTKLLTLKFGPLSPSHEAVIADASAERLDVYVERVLSAVRIDDVFEP